MDHYVSSHSIIKALKGAADPPDADGPSKIVIALFAWRNPHVFFPSKDELLAEWILNTLGRSKGNDRRPLHDVRYWSLLNEVLATEDTQRTNKFWIVSILNRTSLSSISTAFLSTYSNLPGNNELASQFSRCMFLLWPQAAPRMNLDILIECFGACLSYMVSCDSSENYNNEIVATCLLLVRSFRQVLSGSASKKKTFSLFIEKHSRNWLTVSSRNARLGDVVAAQDIGSEVLQAGIDILFSVDTLKSSQSPFEAIITLLSTQIRSEPKKVRMIHVLFKAYVQEVHKHRSAIFSSGSKAAYEQTVEAKAREAGLHAFYTAYQLVCDQGAGSEAFQCLGSLLEVVEEANLIGQGSEKDTITFGEIAGMCVNSIADQGEKEEKVTTSAIRILTVLSRINYDIIKPLLKDVFWGFLILGAAEYPGTLGFFQELSAFHSKTRTVSSLLSVLLDTLSVSSFSDKLGDTEGSMQEMYQTCLTGSLLNSSHLEELSKSISRFLTPGQVTESVRGCLQLLQESRDAFSMNAPSAAMSFDELRNLLDGNSSGRRKRRKIEDTSLSPANLATLSFSLSARLVAVVLPSLPFSTLSESAYSSICSEISSRFAVFAERTVTAISSDDCPWSEQIMAAATLRIRHSLAVCPSLRSLDVLGLYLVPADKIDTLASSLQTVPELLIEMIRHFFDNELRFINSNERAVCITSIIRYVKAGLNPLDPDGMHVIWDGSVARLSVGDLNGHRQGAQALWHLILERWLANIDYLASMENLKEIARLCFYRAEAASSYPAFSFERTLERAIRSAETWELPRFREAMVSVLDELSDQVDWSDIEKLLSQAVPSSKQASTVWHTQDVRKIASIYKVLLWAPQGYLPRVSKSNLLRRAVIADLIICISSRRATADKSICQRASTLIRVWLNSMLDSGLQDFLPNKDNYVTYAVSLGHEADSVDAAYEAASLDLIASLQKHIIRQSVNGEVEQIRQLCVSLGETGLSTSSRLGQQSLARFIDVLIKECPRIEKMSLECVDAVKELYSILVSHYSPAMAKLAHADDSKGMDDLLLQSFAGCLILKRWLGNNDRIENFGAQLLAKVVSADNRHEKSIGAHVLILLLREHPFKEAGDREKHLSLIVACYVSLLKDAQTVDVPRCDSALNDFTKLLPLEDYGFLLSFLREALSNESSLCRELSSVIHLSTLLVTNNPEGSLKLVQEHFEQCLCIFLSNGETYLTGRVELVSEVLDFIASVCNDKPASLRPLALGPIWTVLARILAESKSHTAETHFSILNSIANIAGALIRLRRDLVRSTLPHLGHVLRLLFRALPAVRPQLGARQRALVSDTFPWWMSASVAPARPLEARAVARLLTMLTAKTVPRTFGSTSKGASTTAVIGGESNERRAESLAGAFSKHAAPVLAAYIGALGDPLLVFAPAMREALAPGLYALCGMMGGHRRDALMASGLDATGRAALKMLWREYEKQRYVGKG